MFISIKKFFSFGVFIFLMLFAVVPHAIAAITEDAPPIDAFFEPINNVGAGSLLPLAQFRLAQLTGTDTLSKIGFQIVASTTMTQGEISRVSLWKESGATFGFQPDQDTFIPGAASTSPMSDSTLIVLTPATAVTVGSSGVQFYIIASTTAVSGITNSHAFNVALQANYASTTGGLGLGTAFSSNKKAVLNQTAPIKISEIKIGATGNPEDEFVELYNTGSADINLADLPLSLYLFNSTGGAQRKTLNYVKKVIPGYGFFLIGSASNYSNNSVSLDASYDTITGGQFTLGVDGGLSIATSSVVANATSSKIDMVCWGAQPSANCENSDTVGAVGAPLNLQDGTSMERLAQGYPMATSTAGTLAQGGVDAGKGNGVDRNDNSAEFVVQTNSGPQNSSKPKEFPFGGGMQDTSTVQVQGSFPGNNQTNVSPDINFVGFMLNKTLASGTIVSATPTTTVTLVAQNSGTNLCSSVSYNPFPGNFEPQAKCNLSALLSPSTTYTFTATSSMLDLSGNPLDQNGFQMGNQPYQITFTTGLVGQTQKNITPPMVVGVSPFKGGSNIPRNLSKIAIEWNQAGLDLSTLNASNITLSGGITLSAFNLSTSTSKNILTATLSSTLTANTTYTLTVSGVRTLNGVSMPSVYTSTFTTSSASDTTGPGIVGVIPTNGLTITANTNDFIFSFDDNIDTTTATSGAVVLSVTGGSNLPAAVSYLPVAKEGHIVPNNVLPIGQSLTLTLKGASIKNVSGIYLGLDVTRSWTVEAVNTDTAPPSVMFVNADDFSVAITWNEAVNQTDATNLSNYTLTVGGVAQTLSALAGQSMSYDSTTRTVRLTGLRINAGSQFTITAQNIRDISGNTMTSVNSFTATASSFAQTGGNVGPGTFSGSTSGDKPNFTSSGIGFMPPVNIRPQSTFISASTTYSFELPISSQIPANGTIVVTFPSSSDFGLCCTATTSSNNPFIASQNSDINGPGPGTVGIKNISTDTLAKTVTITLDTATRLENSDTHDFLKFTVAGLKNPSIPKGIDSSGYSIDIKSKNASGNLLESFNANPIYITGGTAGGGAVTTIRGLVSGNGGNLKDVTVRLMSPQTGPLEATTDSNGVYQFTNIPVGTQFLTNNFGGGSDYMVFTDPFISGASDANGATSTTFFGSAMPTPVQATSTSIITRNFALIPTTASITFTVKLTAAASTFTTAETVDVFAGGPGQFVVKTVTPGASALNAATLTTIPIPRVNGIWGVGIGPAMPKSGGSFNGPPPSPNWAVPKPVSVVVSGCPSACTTTIAGSSATSNTFTISTADKTISGVLKDGSGNSIAGAMVFAFAPSTDSGGGSGNNTQSSTAGSFSLKVVAGSYIVGAYSPGIGESRKVTVVVDSSGNVYVDGSATASTGSSGANPFVLKMVKPGYTITGQVTDGTNAIGNAPVFAYRTDAPGRADALTDSSTGNYTLYVDNGTWKVSSFIPGFGPMSAQTVTISGSSQSNINFAPSSSQTFSILSGNIYEDSNSDNAFTTGEGLTGAIIRLSNGTSVNEGISGSDGAYTIRVPSATGYTIQDVFSPSYGKIAAIGDNGSAIGTINLTASTTKNIRVPVRGTVNISIKDSSGNLTVVSKALIDLFDKTTGLANHVEITNSSSTSMLLASSTSAYTVRAYIQGVPPANISVASDSAGTTVTSGTLKITHPTESIKIVVNTSSASLSTISGTVYKTSATSGNELDGAWIQFVDQTNGVQFGTQATSSGGYSIKASNGTYQVLVSKPQYIATPITVTVSGATSQNFILTQSSLTISGTVTAGGSAASSAFVRGEKVGGGQAITQTSTDGTYTLNVTPGVWRIFATADGYLEAGSASNPLTVSSSQSSINVTPSVVASITSTLNTSNTFTDTSAGSFSDTSGNKISLDANALGSASASAYLTVKQTSNYPDTTSVNIVASRAQDISAFSGGNQVTDLQSGKKALIELIYTKAELVAAGVTTVTAVGKLTVVSYSTEKADWETLSTVATYKDSSGNAVTPSEDLSNVSTVSFIASGTHFSNYALSSPTGVTPPDVPTGLTATAAVATAQVALSWSSVSAAEGYYLYRDTAAGGSFPLLADVGTATTYTNTGLSIRTTYYYKVSAYKSSGASESAASTAVSATTFSGGDGGVIVSGGGSGSGYTTTSVVTAQTSATTKALTPTVYALATPASAPGLGGVASGYRFLKIVNIGSSGDDVKALQDILEVGGFLKVPKGVAKGYFGAQTKNAIKKFQKAHGIAKEGGGGYGNLGPKTRAKLNELVATPATPAVPEVSGATPATPAVPVKPASMTPEVKAALIDSLLKQLSTLQEALKQLKASVQ